MLLDRSDIRKRYSKIGAAYAMFVMTMYAASLIIKLVVKKADIVIDNSWVRYLIGLAPIWVFGFPVCYLMIKEMEKRVPDDHRLSLGYGFSFYFMLTFLMLTGNIVGRLIAWLIELSTGLTMDNTTIDMISSQNLLPSFVFAVIIAPVMEEIAFRKLLIDRLWFLSKKHTIFLSGIMFALFHTNLFQFFYAFLVGTVFAYIYTITGRIRYTIMLHMTINFMHGILPVALLKMMDIGKLASITTLSPNSPEARKITLELIGSPGFILFILYCLMILGFFITGIVLFCKNVKKMKVDDTNSYLQGPGSVSVIYRNAGMMTFIIVMLIFSVIEVLIS